eukprot:16219039-Heterocapsa_arctica.AAC.1
MEELLRLRRQGEDRDKFALVRRAASESEPERLLDVLHDVSSKCLPSSKMPFQPDLAHHVHRSATVD